jgi:hypothetical protein
MMSKSVWEKSAALVRTGACWASFALVSTAAFAQAPAPVGGSSQAKSYVYQYMLVGLCVALGLVLLCRPRKRGEEVQREKE